MKYKNKHSLGRRSCQQGFTLIEVIVAMAVVAIGMLGIAGLTVASQRNNTSSYYRTVAIQLSNDIVEKMRSNKSTAKRNLNDFYVNATVKANCRTAAGAGCSADEMLQDDIAQFKQAIATRLPNGVAMICLDVSPEDGTSTSPSCDVDASGTSPVSAVKIWWTDDRSGISSRFVSVY